MLQGEHSAILLAFIKLLFVIKIFVLSRWPFYTGSGSVIFNSLLIVTPWWDSVMCSVFCCALLVLQSS